MRNACRRRRRQQTSRLTTICEPRFIALVPDTTLLLIWLCPEGEQVPSSEQQQRLCDYLFELGVVSRCKLPRGEFMIPPEDPTLPSTRLVIEINMNFITWFQ